MKSCFGFSLCLCGSMNFDLFFLSMFSMPSMAKNYDNQN